jgi:NAD(P)H-hydrate repair Nnr-like enzyme with NAD(P)H-hydrate dehydratase domain
MTDIIEWRARSLLVQHAVESAIHAVESTESRYSAYNVIWDWDNSMLSSKLDATEDDIEKLTEAVHAQSMLLVDADAMFIRLQTEMDSLKKELVERQNKAVF